jgi:hypothetical protein
MRKMKYSGFATVCVALSLLVIGCSAPAPKPVETPVVIETKPDMAAIKAEIQALENAWSAADNARNADAVAAFYATMPGVCQTINQQLWVKQLFWKISGQVLQKKPLVPPSLMKHLKFMEMKTRLLKLVNQQLKMQQET